MRWGIGGVGYGFGICLGGKNGLSERDREGFVETLWRERERVMCIVNCEVKDLERGVHSRVGRLGFNSRHLLCLFVVSPHLHTVPAVLCGTARTFTVNIFLAS